MLYVFIIFTYSFVTQTIHLLFVIFKIKNQTSHCFFFFPTMFSVIKVQENPQMQSAESTTLINVQKLTESNNTSPIISSDKKR